MNGHGGLKRILLSSDAVGGVWPYTVELARAFSRRRVEVEIAVLGPSVTPMQRSAIDALHGVRLHETGLPLDWTAEAAGSLSSASSTLAALARRLDVDSIQLHTPALVGQSRWHAPVLAAVHSCVGTWWNAVRGGPAPEDFLWRMAAVHAGLQAADCVVAPTRAFADAVRTTYCLQRDVDVVHNGRTFAGIDPSEAEQREGVLTAGRLWDEGKGLAILDGAALLMDKVAVKAAGALVAPSGAKASFQRVQMLGTLDEQRMTKAMARARIFASPARYEPFGLAVLEAALAGLPLVLADIPTFRELWQGAAIFLPPTDAALWASTLSTLHAHPESCHQWGVKARARAKTYTVERFDGAMWKLHCLMLDPAARAAAAA